jgi:hypothetical protein
VNLFLNHQFKSLIGAFGWTTDFQTDKSVGSSMSIGTSFNMAPER